MRTLKRARCSRIRTVPLLQVEDFRHLFGGQFLHVVEDKNDAQIGGDAQDGLMQKMVLLGVQQVAFRTSAGILEQTSKLIFGRHQLVE